MFCFVHLFDFSSKYNFNENNITCDTLILKKIFDYSDITSRKLIIAVLISNQTRNNSYS